MRQLWKALWLASFVLGIAESQGCSHIHHECDCTQPSVSVVAAPETVPPAAAGASVHAERSVQPSASLPEPIKPERPIGTIEVTVVGPSSEDGSCTGTLLLTTKDAEAMGIRPGDTPGARFISANAQAASCLGESKKAEAD